MAKRKPKLKPRDRKRRQPPPDLSQPLERLGWDVGEDDHKQRLDRFLTRKLDWRSRTSIVELLEAGRVLCNGVEVTRKAWRLKQGDRVEVKVPPPEEDPRHEELAEELDGLILEEDGWLVVVAKPPGWVMHPVGPIRVNTLIQALHYRYLHGPRREEGTLPRICHRLDRETSGVVVLAKTPRARTKLAERFETHDLEKEYVAVLRGVLEQDEADVRLAIGPCPEANSSTVMTTREDGAPSRTVFRVLARGEEATLVRCRIYTGRQHQIRLHARALGHPVWRDPLYGDGDPADLPGIDRQALHAWRLRVEHPSGSGPVEWIAPVPDDLRALVAEAVGPAGVRALGALDHGE